MERPYRPSCSRLYRFQITSRCPSFTGYRIALRWAQSCSSGARHVAAGGDCYNQPRFSFLSIGPALLFGWSSPLLPLCNGVLSGLDAATALNRERCSERLCCFAATRVLTAMTWLYVSLI